VPGIIEDEDPEHRAGGFMFAAAVSSIEVDATSSP
jgi:hypothetical protein